MESRDHPDWWRAVGGHNAMNSVLERRSTLFNDNLVETPDAPPSFYTGAEFKGKFFPRGCRGKIERIEVYCNRTAAGLLYIRYAPHPGLGYFYQVAITPGAAWDWYGADIELWWPYDSLFIWIWECPADVSWGYDGVQPHDGHEQVMLLSWDDITIRPFIRVDYSGETPGDVPVSGTLTVVELPSIGTEDLVAAGVAVAHNSWQVLGQLLGAGTLIEARVIFYTSVTPTNGAPPGAVTYMLRLLADGGAASLTTNRDLTQSGVAAAGRNSIGEFYQITVADPAYDITQMNVRLPIKFRHTLDLAVYQSTGGAVNADGSLYANLLR